MGVYKTPRSSIYTRTRPFPASSFLFQVSGLGRLRLQWWAWIESNYRPHAYQACALTGLSYRPLHETGNWKQDTRKKRNHFLCLLLPKTISSKSSILLSPVRLATAIVSVNTTPQESQLTVLFLVSGLQFLDPLIS